MAGCGGGCVFAADKHSNAPMTIETLIPLISGALAAAGAIYLHSQRTNTERSQLASEQYANASKMVEQYVDDLHELSERVGKLQLGLLQANEELATLKAENTRLQALTEQLKLENSLLRAEVEKLGGNGGSDKNPRSHG